MDGRRTPTIIGSAKKTSKETDNHFIKSLWVYGLMGMINIVFIIMGTNYIFQMSVIFGVMMFMLMTSLIADFSSVLLDVRDKNMLLSKPVRSITLNMAKVIHIVHYLFFITVALVGPALAVALIRHGILFFLLFFLEIVLLDLFIVTLTALLYLGILRFFDGEKLKDIINYVQISLSIMVTVGYQLIGRLFDLRNLNISFQPRWWQYLIIPVWFGAPFEVLLKGNFNSHYIVFAVLALIMPILSIYLYIKFIPAFERSLQKLNSYSQVKGNEHNILNVLSKILCSDKQERSFFKFASRIIGREREFKLRAYPTLGFALIFPFIFLANQMGSEGFRSVASSGLYFNIYFCALFLPTVLVMMQYSADYKGSWVYRVMPIKGLGSIYRGCFKAFLVHLMLPIYLFECIAFLLIFGMRILPDLIAVLFNIFIFSLICFKSLLKDEIPFSKPFTAMQQENKWAVLPLMIVLGVLGGIHFLFTQIPWGIFLYMPVTFILNVILWRRSKLFSNK